MPKKKDETTVEENGAEATEETAATEETGEAVEAQAGETETAREENTEATEETPKKSKKAKSEDESEDAGEETSILDAVVGAVASAVETVASGVAGTVTNLVSGSGDDNKTETKHGKRSERIGMVTSDKMTKTVVVRVDRLVKHPKYRKYVRRKKQFMAHDELGATIGDKVRIIETRPLSARKRWRVVEIVQKAAK
jgi:small subunit ribosomal protein S17